MESIMHGLVCVDDDAPCMATRKIEDMQLLECGHSRARGKMPSHRRCTHAAGKSLRFAIKLSAQLL